MQRGPAFLNKPMHEMSHAEWEDVCDGCGLCCQIRLEDEDSGEITLTNAACRLLNLETLKCSDYVNRKLRVHDCIKITPDNVHAMDWLPQTCGYRLVAQKKPLPSWHHLICGDRNRVHTHGPSMKGELICEDDADFS